MSMEKMKQHDSMIVGDTYNQTVAFMFVYVQ